MNKVPILMYYCFQLLSSLLGLSVLEEGKELKYVVKWSIQGKLNFINLNLSFLWQRDLGRVNFYETFEKKINEKHKLLKESGRGLVVSWALCAVCIFGHVSHFFGAKAAWIHALHSTGFHMCLSLFTLLGPGRQLIMDGLRSLLRGSPNMNTLVGLGALSSFAVSSLAAFIPKLGWKTFFEEPVMLIAFVLLGRNLEQRAKIRATSDMTGLLSILPSKARLLINGDAEEPSSTVEVPSNSLSVGDEIIVLPGEVKGMYIYVRGNNDFSELTVYPPCVQQSRNCDVRQQFALSSYWILATPWGFLQRLKSPAGSINLNGKITVEVAGNFTYGVMALSAATFMFWNLFGSRILPAAFHQGSSMSLALQLSCSVLVAEGTFTEEPGSGAVATIDEKKVAVGTLEWVQRHGVVGDSPFQEVEEFKNQSVVYVGVDGVLAGVIYVEDQIREDARQVIESLTRQGINTYLLSGDKRSAAEYVASVVGIPRERVLYGVKPDEKKKFISRLQEDQYIVAMVGDGINDAAALASSDVGVAIGGGVGAASEVSSIVLMQNRLSQLLDALELSRLTMRTVKQNLWWAFAYNIVGIPVAAGTLLPVTGTMLSPSIAGALMGLSSIGVMTNSLLLRLKFKSIHKDIFRTSLYIKAPLDADHTANESERLKHPYTAAR
ncbi:UNVERIFIED_CONTAM: Copper-transporting ATPase PAA1, chloroplastic [Sesamum calycinum]|uniref:Copper-transporting ATPase PAA1, chloroplastic n=1 Tax=Sesamum calycinum TaxID=2727403 RepID=A0AAW2PMR8_9LAMI